MLNLSSSPVEENRILTLPINIPTYSSVFLFFKEKQVVVDVQSGKNKLGELEFCGLVEVLECR